MAPEIVKVLPLSTSMLALASSVIAPLRVFEPARLTSSFEVESSVMSLERVMSPPVPSSCRALVPSTATAPVPSAPVAVTSSVPTWTAVVPANVAALAPSSASVPSPDLAIPAVASPVITAETSRSIPFGARCCTR